MITLLHITYHVHTKPHMTTDYTYTQRPGRLMCLLETSKGPLQPLQHALDPERRSVCKSQWHRQTRAEAEILLDLSVIAWDGVERERSAKLRSA